MLEKMAMLLLFYTAAAITLSLLSEMCSKMCACDCVCTQTFILRKEERVDMLDKMAIVLSYTLTKNT